MKRFLAFILMLILTASVSVMWASAANEQRYISRLALSQGEYEGNARDALREYGEMVGADFELVSYTDLNSGCGESTDYIFLAAEYSTDVRDAVCDIVVLSSDHADEGYVWVNPYNGLTYQCVGGALWTGDRMWEPLASVDINATAGGYPGYIFVCCDLRAGEPITLMDVAFSSWYECAALDEDGMIADVNAGTYGDVLFICFSRYISGETSWFNVTFDSMGLGIFDGAENVRNLPDEFPTPENRFGITFHGWYLDEGHTKIAEPGAEIFGDTTVYARNGYTVTFETDGGTEILPLTDVEVLPDVLPEPVREGFVFGGWYTEGKKAGVHKLSGNEILTARWISETEIMMKDFAAAYSSYTVRSADSLIKEYTEECPGSGAKLDALIAALSLNGLTVQNGEIVTSDAAPDFDRSTPVLKVMLKFSDLSTLKLIYGYYADFYRDGDRASCIKAVEDELDSRGLMISDGEFAEKPMEIPDESDFVIGTDIIYASIGGFVIFTALALYLNRRERLE